MKYFEFRQKIEDFPYFETKELRLVLGESYTPSLLVNLKNWINKGYLMMLRRGLYVSTDAARGADPMVFAAKLYAPSYVSLEMALGFYGIIPEAVFTVTSVTTRKTKKFKTPQGDFSYQKIKREAFGGYETKRYGKFSFNVALPEKAVVDFLYLNRNILDGSPEQFRGYRFNEDFSFDEKKLLRFAQAFQNTKTELLTRSFIQCYVAR